MKAIWLATWLSITLVASALAQPQTNTGVEVRFCPKAQVRPYPLDAGGRLQSLMVPGIVVINRGSEPLTIGRVAISLADHGRVLDTRELGAAEIERWVGNGPPLQKEMRETKFEFCGDALVPSDVTLAGPVLQRNEGLIIVNETFAYDHSRDAVVVSAEGVRGGRAESVRASLPITPGFSKTQFIFPLKGEWWVGEGPSFHTGHRAHVPEQFALDIGKLGPMSRTYRGDGLRFEDYYAYGSQVLAAADGRVVRTEDDQPQNPSTLQRPGESMRAYMTRHDAAKDVGIAAKGSDWAAGNFVMIDHGNDEYSLYAHLQPGSVRVRPGELVKAGEVIGLLGSSGNSTEPHLHFHVCDRPSPLRCDGIPVDFTNLTILWADTPRAIQSGDIVTAR
jgi:murein DD-endopeptidase MepM/ murein hydrolase activator NlpD